MLTVEQLTSLWLFYVEELPLEDIARVLGRSAGAAKGLLFRGRRKLAQALEGEAEVPAAASLEGGESAEAPRPSVDKSLFKMLPPRLAAELYDG